MKLNGEYVLDAVDMCDDEDACAMKFRLNGVVYLAAEDPDDGYRSMLAEVVSLGTEEPMQNVFPPVKVFCKRNRKKSTKRDVYQIFDKETNKLVLEVGTDYSDEWYPCCVMNFNPKAMIINKGEK